MVKLERHRWSQWLNALLFIPHHEDMFSSITIVLQPLSISPNFFLYSSLFSYKEADGISNRVLESWMINLTTGNKCRFETNFVKKFLFKESTAFSATTV
jgi:hypothetical protein